MSTLPVSPRLQEMAERAKTSTEEGARNDCIRKRLAELEQRAIDLAGENYVLTYLVCQKYGWRATCTLQKLKSENEGFFPTATEALDDLEARLSAFEDRDGNLARTLGIESAA